MVLARIQHALAGIYDLPTDMHVDDFVCAPEVAEAAVADARARREVLVVAEAGEDVSVGLYVCPDALAALEDGGDWLGRDRFGAACLATEGVSHFMYFVFRAGHRAQMSQLELELQGEVDKYAAGLLGAFGGDAIPTEAGLRGNGVGAILAAQRRARWLELSRELRRRLFDEARFLDGPGSEAGERYRTAHRQAASWAQGLEQRHVAAGDVAGATRELRRYYRLGLREKLQQTD